MPLNEIVIVSFKHNGKVHRTWFQTYLLEDNDDYIVVGSSHSLVIEADGRNWYANEPAISIFFKKQWFNVVCMLKKNGIFYYVNIASPSIIENNIIKYIDYDLDYKVSPDYYIKALDEFEYKKHRKDYNYSASLDYIIKRKFYEIKKKIVSMEFPFKKEYIESLYAQYEDLIKND